MTPGRSTLVLVLLASTLLGSLSAQTCGDCDGNGAISITDSLRAAQFAAMILMAGPADVAVCDVDDSTAVSILDALLLAQTAAGFAPAMVCPGGPPNLPPQVTNVVPAAPFSGNIAIDYLLSDAESNTCSLTILLSTDGGATFPMGASSGPGGDGTVFLSSSPGGTPHTYVWDSLNDLGTTLTTGVVVQFRPSDPRPGVSGFSNPFTVDNASLNMPPTIAMLAPVPATPQIGDVTFGYSLLDAESDSCSIQVEVSTDGGASYTIMAADGPGGDGRAGLTSSPGGLAHTYVWDSLADLGATLQSSVVVRMTPSDLNPGPPATTSTFVVDNRPPNSPPVVSSIVAQMPHAGDISVTYMLADAESDVSQIQVHISTDGGATFPLVSTDAPGGDGRTGLSTSPAGTAHTYVWDSVMDLGMSLAPSVVVRITPMDAQLGTPATSAAFSVDNSPPPMQVLFSLDVHPTMLMTTPGGMGCVLCHGGAGPAAGLDLTTWLDMMSGSSSGLVVVPGSPGTSEIICRLEGSSCGNRMPRNGTPWTSPMIQTFRDWITQGAMDN